MLNELEKWIVEDMIERLDNVYGLDGYPCDLAFSLYDEDNHNGVISGYSQFSGAKEWIKTFWDELQYEAEDYKFNFGEYLNPFENECTFMVCIVLNAAGRLIAESEYIDEHWNDEVTYTKEVIEQIKSELKELI